MSAAQTGRHGLGLTEPEQGDRTAPACADCGTPTGLALVDWLEGTATPLCQRCIIARCSTQLAHVVEVRPHWIGDLEDPPGEPVDVRGDVL